MSLSLRVYRNRSDNEGKIQEELFLHIHCCSTVQYSNIWLFVHVQQLPNLSSKKPRLHAVTLDADLCTLSGWLSYSYLFDLIWCQSWLVINHSALMCPNRTHSIPSERFSTGGVHHSAQCCALETLKITGKPLVSKEHAASRASNHLQPKL